VLFPLSVWKANEALLAGRDKAITGVWLAPEDEPGDAEALFDRVRSWPSTSRCSATAAASRRLSAAHALPLGRRAARDRRRAARPAVS
jgi:hypothetical protein